MKLSELREAARIAYLGVAGDQEDPRFPDAVLDRFFNDAHRDLAFRDRLYRTTRQYNLPLGGDGVSWVGLDPDVFDVVPDTVRLSDGTRETELQFREETWLLRHFGPLRNRANGTPSYYYLRKGAELREQRMLAVYPGSDVARPGALFVGVYIYPALMTNDSDTPAFQPPEHDWLVQQVLERMAQLEARQGRPDAPVGMEHELARDAEAKLRKSNQRGTRQGPWRIKNKGW